MNMKKLILALCLLASTPAVAQWQVPDHAVPIGRGPGFTGFKSAAPGAAGQSLISQGASRDPIFAAPSAANKVLHVSTAGNDANDGLTWTTAKLTIQAGLNAAATGGKVIVGAGTYVSGQIDMKPSVTLECISGAIITQANGANLDQLINFFPGPGATIRNCTLDGNRANNTGMLLAGAAKRIIYVGNDNVTIDGNTIQNGPGYAVNGPTAIGLVMTRNVMTNTEAGAFFADVSGHILANCLIEGNRMDSGLSLIGFDGCFISNNHVIGTMIGGLAAPLRVNTSGTTVTWVSGPTFANVKSGMTIIGNQTGTAFQQDIKTVNSTTSLTTVNALPTLNNVLAAIGNNDLMGMGGGAKSTFSHNYLKSGVSFGLSFFGYTCCKLDQTVFANNILDGQGKHGFALLGDGGGAGGIGAQDVIISGNIVVNSGLGGPDICGANCSSYLLTNNNISNILLSSNHARDATGNTSNWLNLVSVVAGSVFVDPGNTQIGATSPGIRGGISSITLSAGWGNTAATSAIVSYGSSAIFTVTANGTGIAANPTITVNTIAAKPAQGANVIYTCKQVGGTGALTVLSGEQNSTPAQIGAVTFNGTPVAANTYIIQCS
jgi:hypothetical protein